MHNGSFEMMKRFSKVCNRVVHRSIIPHRVSGSREVQAEGQARVLTDGAVRPGRTAFLGTGNGAQHNIGYGQVARDAG